jgi:RNA polymerase-binding protein DksA
MEYKPNIMKLLSIEGKMMQPDKVEVRSTLEENMNVLSKELQNLQDELQNLENASSDVLDNAVLAEDRRLLITKIKQKNISINQHKKALARMEEFGICEDCDLDIEPPRLVANPVTTTCIHCQTIRERRSTEH